jgi:hypothetical protein
MIIRFFNFFSSFPFLKLGYLFWVTQMKIRKLGLDKFRGKRHVLEPQSLQLA